MLVLNAADARQKIRHLPEACHQALLGKGEAIPILPGRDIAVVDSKLRLPRPGLNQLEGRARLLHDMANIELQAMELALRGLIEYPDAPTEFRDQLVALTLSEGEHFELCLNGLEELGYEWGHWPIHLSLWQTVGVEDSLLDRILIVHRYLEGSGLDAGDKLLTRLKGLAIRDAAWRAVERIHREEIGHVDFGSRWYREVCRIEGRDPDQDFFGRLRQLAQRLPGRTENLALEVRRRAGFTEQELRTLTEFRAWIPKPG